MPLSLRIKISPLVHLCAGPHKPGSPESYGSNKCIEDFTPRITGRYYCQSGECLLFGNVTQALNLVRLLLMARNCPLSSQPQWKENPELSENHVQSIALGRQASVEMELKHREAVYRDVLTKQQTVSPKRTIKKYVYYMFCCQHHFYQPTRFIPITSGQQRR